MRFQCHKQVVSFHGTAHHGRFLTRCKIIKRGLFFSFFLLAGLSLIFSGHFSFVFFPHCAMVGNKVIICHIFIALLLWKSQLKLFLKTLFDFAVAKPLIISLKNSIQFITITAWVKSKNVPYYIYPMYLWKPFFSINWKDLKPKPIYALCYFTLFSAFLSSHLNLLPLSILSQGVRNTTIMLSFSNMLPWTYNSVWKIQLFTNWFLNMVFLKGCSYI